MSKTLQEWLDWQETLHPREIDLGLQRVSQVIKTLLPECYRSEHGIFPFSIITIAGTNGKGSTTALLESILCSAGYRVGSYTSPHIFSYNERIKINQTAVSDQAICDAFSRIDKARADTSLSYFEFGTLAAIDIMVQESCELVILEVGLGGRLDAVNVLDADIALVTTVDLDHQDWLGNDRDTIALEKAGIYRSDKPALYGDDKLPETIKQLVDQQKLSFYQFSTDYHYSLKNNGLWDWSCNHKKEVICDLPAPALKGKIQYKNAANALMILELLKKQYPVTKANINSGLKNAKLLGRFQKISDDPLVILDVAHNEQAVQVLKQSLEEFVEFDRLHVIVGMLKDKDCKKIIEVLHSIVSSWRVIDLETHRAKQVNELADIITQTQTKKSKVETFPDFKQAFDDYKKDIPLVDSNDCLLVFGSFYTVIDALKSTFNKY